MRKYLGTYIVADSNICHGKLTFVGTRVFVRDVLDQVEEGMPWDEIVKEWRGTVPVEAISEAVRLAKDALFTQVEPRTRSRSRSRP